MPETYVCPVCRSTTDRSYRVTTIIRTCSSCGENGRFLHEELLALVDRVPVGERPEGWEEMPLDERLLHAVRAGHVDYDETELF